MTNSPEEFERQKPFVEPPKHDLMCTVNRKVVSTSSMKADGAGAYFQKGNPSQLYHFSQGSSQIAHKDDGGNFYINTRKSHNCTWSKEIVDPNNVYKLKRHYRYNKNNQMSNLIVEVEKSDGSMLDFYYVLYRWHGSNNNSFVNSRHGNAKNPFQGKI